MDITYYDTEILYIIYSFRLNMIKHILCFFVNWLTVLILALQTLRVCVHIYLYVLFFTYCTDGLRSAPFAFTDQVRPQLQLLLRQVHSMIPMTSSEEMVKSLLEKIRTSSEIKPADQHERLPKDLPVAALQSEEAARLCQNWLASNQSRDLGKHPGFARCVTKLSDALCTCGSGSVASKFCPAHGKVAPLTLTDLMFHAASCIYDNIPEMVPFMALGASLLNELQDEACAEGNDPPAWPQPASFLLISED